MNRRARWENLCLTIVLLGTALVWWLVAYDLI